MSLDKKLREITQTLVVANAERSHPKHGSTAGAIEAIKQAFITDNWVHVPQVEVVERWERDKPTEYRVNGKVMMTGAEWLARFEKELKKEVYGTTDSDEVPCFGCSCDAVDAARRASGVDV